MNTQILIIGTLFQIRIPVFNNNINIVIISVLSFYYVNHYPINWKLAGVAYPIVSIPVLKYVIFSILVARVETEPTFM